MRKLSLYTVCAFLLFSLFLPFAYTVDVKNYQTITVSGLDFLLNRPILSVILLVSLTLSYLTRKTATWKIACTTTFLLTLFYLYLQPFHLGEIKNLSQIVTILTKVLAVGYYMSGLCLILLGILLYFPIVNQKERA